jgi:hypothetical protein
LNLLEDSGVISHDLSSSFRREREGRVALGPVSRRGGKETNSLASVIAFGVARGLRLGLDALRPIGVESERKPALHSTGDISISDLVFDAKLAVGSRSANANASRFCAVVLDSYSKANRAIPDGFASNRLADRATVFVISHWLTFSFENQVRLMGR